nr:hypothetical protein Iba_chr07aCG3610 [Ipomoea batatas]GMD14151.1 hypothetical protein Iba_chr07bCG3660 [Ipomoea batatas]GMD15824.1 hypothetical protein Iba_chr07cCG3470 [Ipomoea batatas]GMD20318.1 hypothetical protein Iba_chr07fCG3720 [Ipomoea batatas]
MGRSLVCKNSLKLGPIYWCLIRFMEEHAYTMLLTMAILIALKQFFLPLAHPMLLFPGDMLDL